MGLSTYGIMFAPDQQKAAREIVRVVKPGGRIGLANWTPEGFIGQLLKTVAKHVEKAAVEDLKSIALGAEPATPTSVPTPPRTRRER